MSIYGYARVSTKNQRLQRQIDNIQAFDDKAVIFGEKFTGTKIDRPEWMKLYRKLKEGDTVIFDSVSRMSRNAQEGVQTYFELYERGINLIFLKEPHINTSIYRESVNQSLQMTGNEIADCYIEATNKVFKILAEKQIIVAFEQAQKEVDDLRLRIKEGIAKSEKDSGIRKGRKLVTKKSIKAKEEILKKSKDFNGFNSDIDVMKLTGLSRNSYYKYKRELKEQMEQQ